VIDVHRRVADRRDLCADQQQQHCGESGVDELRAAIRRDGPPSDERESDAGGNHQRDRRVDRGPRCLDVGDDGIAQHGDEAPVEREGHHVAGTLAGVPVGDEADDREQRQHQRTVIHRLQKVHEVGQIRVALVAAGHPQSVKLLPRPDGRLLDDAGEFRRLCERFPQSDFLLGGVSRRVEVHDDEQNLDGRDHQHRPPAFDRADGPPDVLPEDDDPVALAAPGEQQAAVEQQAGRAGPRHQIDERALLDRQREGDECDAREDVRPPPGVDGTDEQRERGEHERRHQRVAAHEPRVVEHERVGRQKERDGDEFEVAQSLPEREHRQRHQTGRHGDERPHRNVGRAEGVEQLFVDVVIEGAVDDGPIFEVASLDVLHRPVGDPSLVPVGRTSTQIVESDRQREDGDAGDGEVDAFEAERVEGVVDAVEGTVERRGVNRRHPFLRDVWAAGWLRVGVPSSLCEWTASAYKCLIVSQVAV